MSSLPRILNHSIWMSDDQVMAKTKTWVKKKRTAFPLKPNIFSIQIFPPLRITTKPNNHSKQGFYKKKGYSKPSNKYPYKILTNSIQFFIKFHKILYISIPDFFFSLNFSSSLLLLFFFLSSSLLSFSFLLFSLPLRKSSTKMGYFGS